MSYTPPPMRPAAAAAPANTGNTNTGVQGSAHNTGRAGNGGPGDSVFAYTSSYGPPATVSAANITAATPATAAAAANTGRRNTFSIPDADDQTSTKTGRVERERTRILLACLVTFLYIAFIALMFSASFGQPSAGIMAKRDPKGQLVVSWVVPSGLAYDRGVRPGGAIIIQDGIIPSQSNPDEEIDLSSARSLLISQDGKQITIVTDDMAGGNQLRRWGYALLGLLFVLTGAPVFVKARQRTAATSFYVFCVATGMALASAVASYLLYGWALALQFAIMLVVAASFAFFFFQFPVPASKTRKSRLFVLGALIGTAAIILMAYLWSFAANPSSYAWIQPLWYLYLASCSAAGLLSLVTSFFREKSQEVKRQHVLLVIGTVLAVVPSLVLGLIPSMIAGRPLVSMGTTVFTFGFMPLFFAYAIIQHQLLGIRGFVRRSVIYLIMGFTVLSAFFIMAAAASAVLPRGWAGEEGGILGFGLFVFLIAVSFGYVQRRVEWMVDRFIYHDAYDYKQALMQFSTQLAAEQDLDVLCQELVDRTCRMMNLDCGTVVLVVHPGEVSEMVAREAPTAQQPTPSDIVSGSLTNRHADTRPVRHTQGGFTLGGKETLPNVHDGGVAPYLLTYASYGECADWLPQSLQTELERQGMDLRHSNAPGDLFSFYAGPLHTTGTTGSLSSGATSPTGPLHRRSLTSRNLLNPEDSLRNKVNRNRNPDPDALKPFLGVPLWTRQRFVGILCLGAKRTGERYGKDDLALLNTLGGQAALAIYNAQLSEMREQALLDTITALAHAIEAKDTYTLNHCEKITGRAVALAQSLGLPTQEVENIRLGSILHDVGKIGIPDAILNKPSRLTDEEYERIKEHAVIGARIVQSVGALQGVVPIVHHHQERFDGSGYPDGLKGDSIPMGARIIAIVDAYGAMTEDRVYRKAPGHEVALSELKRWSGKQFDPYIAQAFIRLLEVQPELGEE